MTRLTIDLTSWNFRELHDIAEIKGITIQELLNIILEEETK